MSSYKNDSTSSLLRARYCVLWEIIRGFGPISRSICAILPYFRQCLSLCFTGYKSVRTLWGMKCTPPSSQQSRGIERHCDIGDRLRGGSDDGTDQAG